MTMTSYGQYLNNLSLTAGEGEALCQMKEPKFIMFWLSVCIKWWKPGKRRVSGGGSVNIYVWQRRYSFLCVHNGLTESPQKLFGISGMFGYVLVWLLSPHKWEHSYHIIAIILIAVAQIRDPSEVAGRESKHGPGVAWNKQAR